MINNLLAIETSSDVTGVSLIVNGEPIDTSEDIIRSKNLAVWIYDILKKYTNCVFFHFHVYDYSCQPGSFILVICGCCSCN